MELYATIIGVFSSVGIGLIILAFPAIFFTYGVRYGWVRASSDGLKIQRQNKERMIP